MPGGLKFLKRLTRKGSILWFFFFHWKLQNYMRFKHDKNSLEKSYLRHWVVILYKNQPFFVFVLKISIKFSIFSTLQIVPGMVFSFLFLSTPLNTESLVARGEATSSTYRTLIAKYLSWRCNRKTKGQNKELISTITKISF